MGIPAAGDISLVVDVQNVAVRIFEPGGLEFSGDVDVAFA